MTVRPSSRRSAMAAVVLLITGGTLIGLSLVHLGRQGLPVADRTATALPPVPSPTVTEPIVPPSPTGTRVATRGPDLSTATKPPTATGPTLPEVTGTASVVSPTVRMTPSAAPTPSPSRSATPIPIQKGLYSLRQRLGVGASSRRVTQEIARELGFGWYLDWTARPGGFRSSEVEYVPMIRIQDGKPHLTGERLREVVQALPGAVWLIGNEPDVKWQDNVLPEVYARVYHDLYYQLKALDPTCRVAIGGVSQPTPLRMRYLDLILEAYQARYGEPMPVDVWNVHNFILREERDSWGVDIPPGIADRNGVLREIADHDDLDLFRKQIIDFRQWMQDRGQQDKPLLVSEYGILMPNEYGFPPEQVEQFMLDTFEFFRTARDPALGYAADGYRLVQRWCWFSLADARYPTGNLAQVQEGPLTPLGEAFRSYAYSLP